MKRAGLIPFLLLVLLGACKQAEKEADRTKEQLSRMAHSVGADGVIDEVSRAYQENVAPALSGAKETTDTLAKTVPAIEAAQQAGAAASETLSAAGNTIVRKTNYYFSRMPDNEAELERMIDSYNLQFAEWLRKNFIVFDKQTFAERASPVKTRYQGRPRPKKH